VGELDPFRDETIEYVDQLKKAGIPVEFELFKGCFHAFDVVTPEAKISKDAWSFLLRAYRDYMDQYINGTN
jgi:acetyl esterase/lipase